MIYVVYVLVAALVVWLSIKASQYIDLIDKTTKLSGAFLGGVLLSAVTSLPELFTSISATMLINKPSLCIGNILGSNIFNLMILAVLIIVFARSFAKEKVARGHSYVALFVALIYIAMALNMFGILQFDVWCVSITTLIVIVLYVLGVKYLACEDGECSECDEQVTTLSLRQIIVRFVAASLGIIVLSVVLTYVTDEISVKLNLGAGFAGAIFLGVATSLPEVSSTITLFRMRNFNIAIGNIIGSNLFNFLVLCIADVLSAMNIYDFSDHKVVNLLVFGGISTLFMLLLFLSSKRWVKIACSVVAVACYFAFLIIK